jgi:hypothetical protein
MRKSQNQPAFASLSSEELEQLADWLRHQTYQAVLDRVRQPRPEGFGLDISVRPLQTLYAKIQKLDRINEHLKEKQQLTLEDYNSLSLGERNDLEDEVHRAIFEATRDLVLSGDNTPAELLALQRLADFSARAEYRAHKIEMDLHRKQITEARLELQKRSLALREGRTGASPVHSGAPPESNPLGQNGESDSVRGLPDSNPLAREGERDRVRGVPPELCDHLGPYAATLDDIEARAAKKFGFQNNNTRSSRSNETLETSLHPRPSAPSAVKEPSPLSDLSITIPSVSSVPSATSVLNPQNPKTHDSNNPNRPAS